MDAPEQRRIVEALVLAAGEPIPATRLAQIVPDLTPAGAKDLVNELNTEYQDQDRAFEIWEVAGGYQIRTRAEFSGYLQQLRKERPLRLSRAALETLAIIAYKQPATRADVEMVRGVDTGAVIKSLMERRLVRIVGHREVPGRPLLYGTSKRFLEVFGLSRLDQLPSLRELEELAQEQGLELPPSLEGEGDASAPGTGEDGGALSLGDEGGAGEASAGTAVPADRAAPSEGLDQGEGAEDEIQHESIESVPDDEGELPSA